MFTLLVLASLGQVYEADFYFTKAQEDWVVDQLPDHDYHQFLPYDLMKWVDMWSDPRWQVRRKANEEVAADLDNLRWMFWTRRSDKIEVQLHSDALLFHFTICQKCQGLGYCQRFVPDPKFKEACLRCYSIKSIHERSSDRTCRPCEGRGYFENWPGGPWSLRHR